MTGHRTRSVFDRYNITSEDDIRAGARKLQGHLETVRKTGGVLPKNNGIDIDFIKFNLPIWDFKSSAPG
jgi:hypothetical protein